MDFTAIEHAPGDSRQPFTLDQIVAICRRAFGPDAELLAAQELDGGEYNTVYHLRLAGHDDVALRVAPPPNVALPWHEAHLMRKEHAIQPYFAPIAPLLARTVMADFTRQIVGRDYLIQTWMPGERWSKVAHALLPEQEETLWRQLGEIARSIHAVRGEAFGEPLPERQFPTWSATVLYWIGRCIEDAEQLDVDTTEMRLLRETASAHAHLLDEIAQPRLLHGDLWTFNLLIDRDGPDAPRISAVLDCDRALWGDPFADWTFHLLPRRATPRQQTLFWDGYGAPDSTRSQRFREQVYEGMHVCNELAYVKRSGREGLMLKVRAHLRSVLDSLQGLSPDGIKGEAQ